VNLPAPPVILIAVSRAEWNEPDTDLSHGWGKETKPPEFLPNLEKATPEAIGCDYLHFNRIGENITPAI
jgi:hypothetical protein